MASLKDAGVCDTTQPISGEGYRRFLDRPPKA
jgi:hypothetical protein